MASREKEISDAERAKEIEELDSLFEDEGDPKFQFSKIFYEGNDRQLSFIADLDRHQIKSMPKAESGESIIKEEFDVDFDLTSLIRNIKEDSVSKNREGRKEGIKFASGGEEEKKKGILRALGLR